MAGRQHPIGYQAALLPSCVWTVLRAWEGSQGPRLYEWAWFLLPEDCQEGAGTGQARFVLLRRSLSDPSKRAYYRVAGPATLTLAEVGLDQYEVRTYRAWYRFMTLALLAHAVLCVVRHRAREKKSVSAPAGLHLSLAEVRRLLRGIDAAEEQRTHLMWWSRFRRRHQARAKQSHTQRRTCQAPPVALPHTLPLPIPLPGLPPLTDARLRSTTPAVRAYAAQARSHNRAVAQARGGRALGGSDGFGLAASARRLRAVGDRRVPLPSLVQSRALGAYPPDSAPAKRLACASPCSSCSLTA